MSNPVDQVIETYIEKYGKERTAILRAAYSLNIALSFPLGGDQKQQLFDGMLSDLHQTFLPDITVEDFSETLRGFFQDSDMAVAAQMKLVASNQEVQDADQPEAA